MPDFYEQIHARRQAITFPASGRLLETEAEAHAYVERLGFVLLNPVTWRTPPPDLRSVSKPPEAAWTWKNSLTAGGALYYGRILRDRGGLLARHLLPALFSVTPTAAYGGDRFSLFQNSLISADAHRLAGIISARGPITTRELRRDSGMPGTHRSYSFQRALLEAVHLCLVTRVDTTEAAIGTYSYRWDAFHKVWPDEAAKGLNMRYEEALATLVRQALATLVAARSADIARLFRLEQPHVEQIADWLVERGEAYVVPYAGETFYSTVRFDD